ncbi:carboxylesterase/lipase family protein [Pseudonocardia lacus]|uniref:carboxylesterase/lipase family protein n=1 Tax=Pseudonocardia lacus TaxID=2835865 RepID=UPI001BDC8CF3|nr:carboxylesterase family protein [Pseudonocardia lacus]
MTGRRWRTRLALVGSIGALAALVGCAGPTADAAAAGGAGGADDAGADAAVVLTEFGAVRGSIDGDTRAFRGLPYAAPPVGPLRWQNPTPPATWPGVREATRAGPACAQQPGELPEGSTSEDCLYLDVTTPSGGTGAKPVIVWVHGGGYFTGAGSNYDARRMAARGDAVVVTVNYRLGVFGFFGHPALPDSGTFGLADQQAALSWVQRNIAAFGGDPDAVTVAGQSAGGISTCAQLTSPSAAGLFDRAVMQSGSCALSWLDGFDYRNQTAASIFQPVAALERQGRRTAADLGCTDPDPAAAPACLRALPVDALMDVQQEFIRPAYGTALLPTEPTEALRSGRFHRVPVLSGQTRDEATQTTAYYDDGTPMSEQTFRTAMAEAFGADEAAVRAEYPRSEYDSAALAWSAIVTDRKWACSQLDDSRLLAAHVPVHHYEFADPAPPPLSPLPPRMPMGAEHASDLWSLFDLAGMPAPLDPEQRRLSEQMIDYWTSFAATGDPGNADGPAWPRFDAAADPPHVQALAPGDGGIGPVDLAAEHHCGFWAALGR